jgi:hypothetical protein
LPLLLHHRNLFFAQDLTEYWNVGSANKSVRCFDCMENVLMPLATGRCPNTNCGRQLADPVPETKSAPGEGDIMAMLNQMGGGGQGVIDFSQLMAQAVAAGAGGAGGAGAGTSMAELMAAQQGVDIEALMQRMLSDSSNNAPPTSKQFLKELKPFPLTTSAFFLLLSCCLASALT